MARSARTATASSPAATAHDPRLLRRRRAELRLRLDPAAAARPCTPAATAIPIDNTETGFDAIFENPIFAGADTSYWIRQTIPFAGGGRAVVAQRPQRHPRTRCARRRSRASRTSTIRARCCSASAPTSTSRPSFRLSANANHLWFAEHRGAGGAAQRRHDPQRRSAGTCRRRRSGGRNSTQNVVFRASGAVLVPGNGLQATCSTNSDRDAASIIPSCSTRS